jgi:hypothetical protein
MAEGYSPEKGLEGFVKTEALILFLAAMAFFFIAAAIKR